MNRAATRRERATQGAPRGAPAPAEQTEQSSLDLGDIFAGAILLFAIPALTYLVLHLADLPVSGRQGKTWSERLEETAELKGVKPPMEARECEMRIARIDRMLGERIPDYVRRSRGEEDTILRDRWQQLAHNLLGECEGQLKVLRDEIQKGSGVAGQSTYLQQIERRLAGIAQTRGDLIKEKVFFND
ncbi:MAG: hypothetical protein ACE5GW_06575 [Planctomycetota bacterium]